VDRQILIGLCGLLGLLIPSAVVFLHRLAVVNWWPHWLIYVWPTSYMLDLGASATNLGAYLNIGISSVLNALLYALVAWAILRLVRGNPNGRGRGA
jgi:hypothetical protein